MQSKLIGRSQQHKQQSAHRITKPARLIEERFLSDVVFDPTAVPCTPSALQPRMPRGIYGGPGGRFVVNCPAAWSGVQRTFLVDAIHPVLQPRFFRRRQFNHAEVQFGRDAFRPVFPVRRPAVSRRAPPPSAACRYAVFGYCGAIVRNRSSPALALSQSTLFHHGRPASAEEPVLHSADFIPSARPKRTYSCGAFGSCSHRSKASLAAR